MVQELSYKVLGAFISSALCYILNMKMNKIPLVTAFPSTLGKNMRPV